MKLNNLIFLRMRTINYILKHFQQNVILKNVLKKSLELVRSNSFIYVPDTIRDLPTYYYYMIRIVFIKSLVKFKNA